MNDLVPLALVPLTQESAPLRRKIVVALREAIELGELQPGTRLVEKDLCRALNVSRTALREAFRELQAEKIITAVPRGIFVSEISDAEAANIYRVRAALESLVAEQFAAAATEMDAHLLEKAVGHLEEAYKANDFKLVLAAKKRFYDVICTGARNAIVRDILDHLSTRINQLRSTSRSNTKRGEQSLAELKRLARALFDRNPKAARAAAIKHIDAAAKTAAENRHPEAATESAKEAAAKPASARRRRAS